MSERSRKYGSRLIKDFDERQDLGLERRTQKMILKREKDVQKLEEQIKSKKSKIRELKSTLSEVQKRIGDTSLVKNLERINVVIVKSKTRVRGKVYFYRKWKWFHICMNDIYDESQILHYKNIVRKKFIKSLTTYKD